MVTPALLWCGMRPSGGRPPNHRGSPGAPLTRPGSSQSVAARLAAWCALCGPLVWNRSSLRICVCVQQLASGKWTQTERNWSVTERELGAVVYAVTKFRHYLLGKPVQLKTDHEAIKFLQRSKTPSGRLYRWMEKLQEYEFEVEHVPGKTIPHVDALSRQY